MIDRGTARPASFGVPSFPGCCSWPPSWSWAGRWSGITPRSCPRPPSRSSRSTGKPEPVVADQIASNSRRSPTDADGVPRQRGVCRCLLERARGTDAGRAGRVAPPRRRARSPLANPQLYRGVPIHLLGTACACCDIRQSLARQRWLYEAWIITPETTDGSLRLRLRRRARGFSDRPECLRARRLQRLLSQDHEVPGGRHQPEGPRAGGPDRLGAGRAGFPWREYALSMVARLSALCSSLFRCALDLSAQELPEPSGPLVR